MQTVPDIKMTGRQAAEHFAATHWEEPRQIEEWSGSRFRLVVPSRHGWDIVRVEG